MTDKNEHQLTVKQFIVVAAVYAVLVACVIGSIANAKSKIVERKVNDIERLRAIVSGLSDLAEKIDGIINDIEVGRDADKETINRLEEEVAELKSDLLEARQAEE